MRVWREGDRIRDESGTGYGDQVADEQIREHIEQSRREVEAGKRAAQQLAFAEAVLALREQERAS